MRWRGLSVALLALVALLVACRAEAVPGRPWARAGDRVDSILPMPEYLGRLRRDLPDPGRLGGDAGGREALAGAVPAAVSRRDTAALVRTYLADFVQRGNVFPARGGFIPPGMPAHSPDIALPFDLSAARETLAAAGYPRGRGLPPLVGVSQAGMEPLCQYAQRQWRNELGVQVEWEIISAGLMVDRLVTQRPAMRITSWAADFPDPDNFLREVIFRRVFGGWCHAQYRSLVEEAGVTPQQARRISLYQAAEKILIEEAALVPLLYARHALLLKPWIKHFPTSPLEWWFWQDVVIER